MWNRPPEIRKSKLDPLADGPYYVMDVDKQNNCKLAGPADTSVELHVAPAKQLSRFRGEPPKSREILPSEAINLKKLLSEGNRKVRKIVKAIQEKLNVTTYVNPKDLIGLRIKVDWSQIGAKGDWKGKIIDYESRNKQFLVKYDIPSSDGSDTYSERLLSKKMPKWKLLKEEK